MLRALLPVVAGILTAMHFALPLWLLVGGFLLCGAAALLLRSPLHAAAMLFLFGAGAVEVHGPVRQLPAGRSLLCAVSIGEFPTVRGRTCSAAARVHAWRDEAGRWHPADALVMLRADTALHLGSGERLLCRGVVRPFSGGAASYRRLMACRGYAGRMWLPKGGVVERSAPAGFSLHRAAVGRLAELGLEGEAAALCRAMAVGERSGLTPGLRDRYARSGTSHLLAVSGLHVGIVFAAVNLLLGWLPLLRRGHLVRSLLAVACIWLYAAATGFAPSTVRAAVMFTLLQASLVSSSDYASLNALCASALLMLAWNPGYLFDISFQLSYLAVAAIILWGVPLCRRLRSRWRGVNLLVDSVVVSLVATVATAPLVAHTFGLLSLSGLVVNPVAVLLGGVVVTGSLLWLLFPFGVLRPLLSALLTAAAEGLDGLVAAAAAWRWGAVEVSLPGGAAAALYALMAAVTLWDACRKPKKTLTLPR